mgnify:CR=1 FL=1
MRAAFFVVAIFAASCGAPTSPPQAEQPPAVAALEVRDAWAAPTPGGVEVSAGYLTISNATTADDRMIAVATPRATSSEVHEMSMDGGVMRMRAVEGGLSVPAGETVALAPGGLHLMFFGVTQPLVEGESIPVTLTFANAGDIEVSLPVRRAASSDASHTGH